MSADAKFWDKIADRYAKRPVGDDAAYQRKLKETRKHLAPDMEVFEFGCGTGSTAIAHAPFAKHILATDVSKRMIEIAESKAQAGSVNNVTFKQAAIEDFAEHDQSFDMVMGHSILHLVEDKEAVIAQVHKLLKPDGVFVSSTACLGDRMKWFKLVEPVGRLLGLMPMVKVFTTEELTQSIVRAGFTIEHQWKPQKGVATFLVARKVEL